MAGFSYVFTREALKRLIRNKIVLDNCYIADRVNEDLNFGICMKDEVLQVNTLDEFKRHRIFPVGIDSMLSLGKRENSYWIWPYTYYPVNRKYDCCSNTLVGYHYVNVEEQYLYRYLVYNVTVLLNNKYNHPPKLPKQKPFLKTLLDSIDIEV
jgi:hypothetical protein